MTARTAERLATRGELGASDTSEVTRLLQFLRSDQLPHKSTISYDTIPRPSIYFEIYNEEESYRYDALGRRIWRRMVYGENCTRKHKSSGCHSSVTRTVWDGAEILYEIRAPGDTGSTSFESDNYVGLHYGVVGYTHGTSIDRPLAIYKELSPVLVYENWRGSIDVGTCPVNKCDDTQIPFAGSREYAFHAMRPYSDGPPSWYGSLIEHQTDGSGLQYKRNRYYEPETGRFAQDDPIGLAGGLNTYGFAEGDPINFDDPFGLCPEWLTRRPCSGGVDAAAGFVPLVSTGVDAATAISGENPLTGDQVGVLGRGVAVIGLVTPVSGGQLRAAGKAIRLSKHYLDQKLQRVVRSADVWDALKNPLKAKKVRLDKRGRPSQQIVGRRATVVQNPDDGTLVNTWPTGRKTSKKFTQPESQ